MSAAMKPFLQKLASGQPLQRSEAEEAFGIIMSGEATPSQIGAFLMALRLRGETTPEIAGAVATMRAKMTKVDAPDNAMDIVGTGGDSSGSYNVSTSTAFVVAGCGVPVAKHGNRALTSRSGAADTLAALGVNLELDPAGISRCIREAGIGFMFAPAHHSAMKHVGPTRVELGTRTIFNLLGPLSNPAGVKRQLLGVFAPEWVEPLAHVLQDLGCEAAWVVHGDGLDEMTLTGATKVAELKNGVVRTFEITPEDAGLPRADAAALKGGDAEHNAGALRALLDGTAGAYRDITLLNAAAALIIAGKADTLKDGVALAAQSIDSGKAKAALDRLVAVSNGKPA
jgi:anthranilate phosphoribosyltransferase